MFNITQILHNTLFFMSINPCNLEKIPICANLTLEKPSFRKTRTTSADSICLSLDKRISKANFVLFGFPTI